MTASPIEHGFEVYSEDIQYTLENETTIPFSTTVKDIPCRASLVFKSFRCPRSHLIFHNYEIRCILPPGASVEAAAQWNDSIAAEAQRLYIKFFPRNADPKLAISQTDITVFWDRDPGTEIPLNLHTKGAKHRTNSIEEPRNKRQKSSQGDQTPPEPSAELSRKPNAARFTGPTPFEAVQESYRSAIRDGRLKYNRVPQLISKSDGPSKVKPWDPYILAAKVIPRALLSKEKVQSLTQSVESTILIVPEAVEWIAETRKLGLTPEDVQRILRTAFVHNKPSSIKQPEQDDDLPPILKIAARALRRARELKVKHGNFGREQAVLRMVAYASIEVSIVAGEATAEKVESWMEPLAGGGKDWLTRSRCFIRFWCWAMANSPLWKGRELPLYFMLVDGHGESTLRTLFQAVFPANAGEFVSSLSSEVYWKDLPALTRLPGLIEIEMVLLGNYVEREIIGSALGCPASYLEGLDPNLFSAVCTRAMTLYQPKLFWEEATGETGQEDQTKEEAAGETGQEDQTKEDELENTASDYEADPDFYNLFGNTFLEYSASQQE